MTTFNAAELDKLERREFQLSVLCAVFVLVLAGGVALLMYPLVFVHPDPVNKWSPRFAFLGFCVLSVLFVAYLFDRQRTVRNLKQSLVDELQRNIELRHQANVDLLHTIPDLSYFQDRLVMDCRRAASRQRPLSLLVTKVKLSTNFSTDKAKAEALGEAARALSRNLGHNDSIYVLSEGLFGMILPDADIASAKRLALKLEATLESVGASSKFTCELLTRSYPDEVQSAHEFQEMVTALLPQKSGWAEVAVNS
jgi:GGDEF domain-containing protein